MTRDKLLRAPLSALGLTLRTHNALLVNGLNTVGDVLTVTEAELLAMRHIGPTLLAEINAKLKVRGLVLRDA